MNTIFGQWKLKTASPYIRPFMNTKVRRFPLTTGYMFSSRIHCSANAAMSSQWEGIILIVFLLSVEKIAAAVVFSTIPHRAIYTVRIRRRWKVGRLLQLSSDRRTPFLRCKQLVHNQSKDLSPTDAPFSRNPFIRLKAIRIYSCYRAVVLYTHMHLLTMRQGDYIIVSDRISC